MARYGMAVDVRRCIGCNACTISCKSANNVPEGNLWTRCIVEGSDEIEPDVPLGEMPNPHMRWVTVGCQHCSKPACVEACPTGATWKDEETGIVRQDYDKCIGCQMCVAACPYEGVRSYNEGDPKYAMAFATGDADTPAHQANVVEKCTFCHQRVERGEVPACMDLCPARARFWGDLDDPESEISKLVASREYMQLLPEMGTEPNVFFLV